MPSVEVVTVTDHGQATSLLQNSSCDCEVANPESAVGGGDVTSSQSTRPKQRLVSLDVFRGLTLALMLLVDDAGKAFPSINHSPWFGVTLADFVMPFFLFGVGVSVSLVFKRKYLANKLLQRKF